MSLTPIPDQSWPADIAHLNGGFAT